MALRALDDIMLTEKQHKEVIRCIRANDESTTQLLDDLIQLNRDTVFYAHQMASKALESNPIGLMILTAGMFDYGTRIFNDLLDRHREESSSDE